MNLVKKEYAIRFVTPAFLGDSEQKGTWRTPPFKALIRQWWRIVEAAGRSPDIDTLRQREGELFGRASDQGNNASQVRLRLDWRGGTSRADLWRSYRFADLIHPEVPKKPGTDLYLGYGPVVAGGKLKDQIQTFIGPTPPDSSRSLQVLVPGDEENRFNVTFRLIHLLGAIGGRSRNGWGSLHFEEGALTAHELSATLDPDNSRARDWLRPYARNWQEALNTDWCHALGRNENDEGKNLLIWRTQIHKSWEGVLKVLAEVKISFRTQFQFTAGGKQPHTSLCDRHILSYPITKHSVAGDHGWRSGNQILFKVLPTMQGYVGLVAHLPHGLPEPLRAKLNSSEKNREQRVWAAVHEKLNNDTRLIRLP